MSDYAELTIALWNTAGSSETDKRTYQVDMHFVDPDNSVASDPVYGRTQINFGVLGQLLFEPEKYGQELSRSLFSDPELRKKFMETRTLARGKYSHLRLRLFIDESASELHDLRWETLYDPENNTWLIAQEDILFSRFFGTPDHRQIRLQPKVALRALVVVANPTNLDQYQPQDLKFTPVDTDSELKRAQKALEPIAITILARGVTGDRYATLHNLFEELRQGYDILYLVCHGAIVEKHAWLWLEGDDGGVCVVKGAELAQGIDKLQLSYRPKLIVLASCQSAGKGDDARIGNAGALAALGPQLAKSGIPAILAMQGDVPTRLIEKFMPAFFQQLADHGQIDLAAAVARSALQNDPDSWMPVLFLRLARGRIWTSRVGFGGSDYDRWPALIEYIKLSKCTAILGPGVLDIVLGSQRELTSRLAEEQGLLLAHSSDEPQHIAQYLALSQTRDWLLTKWLNKLHQEALTVLGIGEKGSGQKLEDLLSTVVARHRDKVGSDPYQILAKLNLPVYITTTPDNLLANALREAGYEPVVDYARWKDDLALLPSNYEKVYGKQFHPIANRPLVYHLFGCIDVPDSLVLTEDDYFDYLMWIDRDTSAIPIGHRLTDDALMFIGFHMQDWDFRVMLRSLLNEERLVQRATQAVKKKGRPSVAVQLEPNDGDDLRMRKYLLKYFSEAYLEVYWGTTEEMIRDLGEQHSRPPSGR